MAVIVIVTVSSMTIAGVLVSTIVNLHQLLLPVCMQEFESPGLILVGEVSNDAESARWAACKRTCN